MLKFGNLLLLVLTFTFFVSGAEKKVSTTSNSLGLIVPSKSYSNKDFIHIYNGMAAFGTNLRSTMTIVMASLSISMKTSGLSHSIQIIFC